MTDPDTDLSSAPKSHYFRTQDVDFRVRGKLGLLLAHLVAARKGPNLPPRIVTRSELAGLLWPEAYGSLPIDTDFPLEPKHLSLFHYMMATLRKRLPGMVVRVSGKNSRGWYASSQLRLSSKPGPAPSLPQAGSKTRGHPRSETRLVVRIGRKEHTFFATPARILAQLARGPERLHDMWELGRMLGVLGQRRPIDRALNVIRAQAPGVIYCAGENRGWRIASSVSIRILHDATGD